MVQQRYSDEQMLRGLREVAALVGQPMSTGAYERVQRARGLPTWLAIVHRFGSWNEACAAAGLATNAQRAGRSASWNETSVAAAVAEFLADPEAGGQSFAAYAAWAKGRHEVPSGQTVRNVFGGWNVAKVAAASR
ncbi:homing endonuclease associated repeat-containing protein [Nocardioides aestuarii]|uniref:Homing endonuclease associated repeat-containing protein n=1 Tax=Nocardioides aestuarii TaxID=252231 RepID=A0ABW4TQG5_9ACTN